MSTENINATEEVVQEIAEEAVETIETATKNSHKGLKACGIVGCIAVAGVAAYFAVKKYRAKKNEVVEEETSEATDVPNEVVEKAE